MAGATAGLGLPFSSSLAGPEVPLAGATAEIGATGVGAGLKAARLSVSSRWTELGATEFSIALSGTAAAEFELELSIALATGTGTGLVVAAPASVTVKEGN